MTNSDTLDYTILKLGSYVAIGLSKREENKANKTIDILLDIKDGKKVSKKDKTDALLYALKKIGDFSLDYDDFDSKEYKEIEEVEDVLYHMIKDLK